MPRKVFTAGEILTAANLNDVSDQSVMVFDDATARTTAIPTPVEGMVTYLSDEDEVQVFDGSAFKAVGPGKILQVVSTTKADTFSTASGSLVDVTGLSVSITPTSASSKVLVTVMAYLTGSTSCRAQLRLLRGSTGISDAAGFSYAHMSNIGFDEGQRAQNHAYNITFLDTPDTTSSTTYKVQIATTAGTLRLNRTNNAAIEATISSITVMEVAG